MYLYCFICALVKDVIIPKFIVERYVHCSYIYCDVRMTYHLQVENASFISIVLRTCACNISLQRICPKCVQKITPVRPEF